MAIQLHSLRPSAIPIKTAQLGQAHVATLSAKPSPGKPDPAAARQIEPAVNFRTVLAGGLATAAAATAAAKSAATAAATSAAATTPGSTSTAAAASATTATSPATAAASPNAVLTAEQVFGANPWLTNPMGSGPDGITFAYNPLYFATASTAAQVAQMVGGTVVAENDVTKNTPGDPFSQQQPNEMVELPDGALINAGLIASLYTHGYPQSMVNQEISNEVAGAEAAATSAGT